MKIIDYQIIVKGCPSAEALASPTPLSFWGGVNVSSGKIQDVHHSLCGETIKSKILCVPYDRGSCSSSGVMLEMIRQGTNPVGILCIEAEAVFALGPMIGRKMYGHDIAIRSISAADYQKIPERCHIQFTENAILIDE